MADRTDLDRERARRLGRAEPLPPVWRPGDNAFVGRVTTAAPAAGQFLLVHPVWVLGTEAEGGTGTLTVNNSVSIPVLLLGPRVPETGDDLLVRWVDHRWVASRSGTTEEGPPTHTLTGCPCTEIPDSLTLGITSAPGGGVDQYVFASSLSWQDKPSDCEIYLRDDPGYYSDTHWDTSELYKFRYHFDCVSGLYALSGLTTDDSPVGYPSEFPIMQWLVGISGNTCSPFSLTNGATDNFVFRSQGITITG